MSICERDMLVYIQETLESFKDQPWNKPLCWNLSRTAEKTLAERLHVDFPNTIADHPQLFGLPIDITDSDDPHTLNLIFTTHGRPYYLLFDLREWEHPTRAFTQSPPNLIDLEPYWQDEALDAICPRR